MDFPLQGQQFLNDLSSTNNSDNLIMENNAVCELTGINGEVFKIPGIVGTNDGTMSILIPNNLIEAMGFLNSCSDSLPASTEPLLLSIPLSSLDKSGLTFNVVTPGDSELPEKITCPVCHVELPNVAELEKHEESHKKINQCPVCEENFNVLTNLQVHISLKHENTLVCPICSKTFSRSASIKSHLMLHVEEDNFICEKCGLEFLETYQYKEHIKSHMEMNNEDKLKADKNKDLDPKKLPDPLKSPRKRLKKRGSTSLQKIPCKDCNKRFTKPSHLMRHTLVHTKEKPYVCETCSRAFTQKGSLQLHVLTAHENYKPYTCPYCNTRTSQRGNMLTHIYKVHELPPGDGIRISCPFCTCRFRKTSTLNCHITRSHPELKHLHIPSENFNTSSNSIESILERALKYSGVGENEAEDNQSKVYVQDPVLFDNNTGELRSYLVTQRVDENTGIKWYRCDRQQGITTGCGKEFQKPSDLARHFRKHTREKPFTCDICQRSYSLKTSLAKHLFFCHLNKQKKDEAIAADISCQECGKIYHSLRALRSHYKLKHNAIICDVCNVLFLTVGEWKRHCHSQQLDEWMKPSQIQVEEQSSIETTENLHPLQTKKGGLDPLILSADGTTQPVMSRSAEFAARARDAHPDDRPHQCPVCLFRFRRRSHLNQHRLQHRQDKSSLHCQCPICGKVLSSLRVVTAHMRLTHSNRRDFKCLICARDFTTRGTLTRHMATCHSDARPFACPAAKCSKLFKTSVHCRKHIRICKYTKEIEVGNESGHEGDKKTEEEVDVNLNTSFQDDNEDDGNQRFLDQIITSSAAIGSDMIVPVDISNVIPEELVDEIVEEVGTATVDDDSESNNISDASMAMVMPSTVDLLPALTISETIPELDQTLFTTTEENIQDTFITVDDYNSPSLLSTKENDQSPEDVHMMLFDDDKDMCYSCDKCFLVYPDKFSLKEHMQTHVIQQGRSNTRGGPPVKEFTEEETRRIALKKLPKNATDSEKLLVQAVAEKIALLNAENGPFLSAKVRGSGTVTNNRNKKYGCTQCSKAFRKKEDLTRHTRTHTGERPFTCAVCSRSFAIKSTLNTHLQTHNAPSAKKQIICHLCNAPFATRCSLRMHMRLHTGAKPFECSECSMKFRTSGHLKNHLKCKHSINESMPRESMMPSDIFVEIQPNLPQINKQHVSVIKSPSKTKKEHICLTCGKEFAKLSQLTKHERVHTGIKPYACLQCGQLFTQQSSLTSHLKIHSNEKNFSCPHCDYKCVQKCNLQAHMRRIHQFSYHIIYNTSCKNKNDDAIVASDDNFPDTEDTNINDDDDEDDDDDDRPNHEFDQVMDELFPQVRTRPAVT